MQASRGAVKVTIISAEALKKKQLEAVQAGVLSLIGGSGKSVSPFNIRYLDPTALHCPAAYSTVMCGSECPVHSALRPSLSLSSPPS